MMVGRQQKYTEMFRALVLAVRSMHVSATAVVVAVAVIAGLRRCLRVVVVVVVMIVRV